MQGILPLAGRVQYQLRMLLTIAVVLSLLWLLGIVTATTFYGFLHIILILAVAMFLIRVIENAG